MKTQLLTVVLATMIAGMASAVAGGIPTTSFGKLDDGREAHLFTLTNRHGLRARLTDFGATLVSMEVPDKAGKLGDVTLGFDSLAGYLSKGNRFYGATVGRFGNRIANGKFTLDGKDYTLATNNQPAGIPCHLHGGNTGFNKVLWTGEPNEPANSVTFTYVSKDGEENYPGTLTTKVTYTLTDANELQWEATATTDAPTIVNLVHHSYWNLSGNPRSLINDHVLTLNAAHYLPTTAGQIPTGDQAPVAGTPMDFTKPATIGDRLNEPFEALKLGGGYNHAWVLNPGNGVRFAARLKDPKSGRVLEISTNQPAIQFYGGGNLDGTATGKNGILYSKAAGCCLETENFPDAPNHPSFPSAVLRPGETYRHVMVHKFSAE